jgi:hypothetical protein
MPTQYSIIIDLRKHTSDPEEALEFIQEFESVLHKNEIGQVTACGATKDGASAALTLVTDDTEEADYFIKDFLEHCEVFQDTKITIKPQTA